MGRVVGPEHVERPLHEAGAEGLPVAGVPQRGVHLVLGAGVAVGVEGDVVHGALGGEARIPRHGQTLGRGQMADVYVGSAEVRSQPGDGLPLRLGGAVPQVVPAAPLLALRYQMVVLGVDAHAPAGGEHVPYRRDHLLVVVQEDVPRGRSHEQLEPHDHGGQHPCVDAGGDRREQAVVGDCLPAHDRLLLPERANVGDGRHGVGHVVHAGHPRVDGCERPGAEVLLPGHPGVAEMHVRIDEPGQHDVAGPQLDPPVPAPHHAPDGYYPPVADPDLGVPELPVDEGPAAHHGLDVQCPPSGRCRRTGWSRARPRP